MSNAISTPALVIQGVPILFIPNSLAVKTGTGVYDVTTRVFGAEIDTVFSQDLATDTMSVVTFNINPVADMINLMLDFKSQGPVLDLEYYDPLSNSRYSISPCVLTTDFELMLGAGKEITIEIKGAPAVAVT
jgi:hypothetical protein